MSGDDSWVNIRISDKEFERMRSILAPGARTSFDWDHADEHSQYAPGWSSYFFDSLEEGGRDEAAVLQRHEVNFLREHGAHFYAPYALSYYMGKEHWIHADEDGHPLFHIRWTVQDYNYHLSQRRVLEGSRAVRPWLQRPELGEIYPTPDREEVLQHFQDPSAWKGEDDLLALQALMPLVDTLEGIEVSKRAMAACFEAKQYHAGLVVLGLFGQK